MKNIKIHTLLIRFEIEISFVLNPLTKLNLKKVEKIIIFFSFLQQTFIQVFIIDRLHLKLYFSFFFRSTVLVSFPLLMISDDDDNSKH